MEVDTETRIRTGWLSGQPEKTSIPFRYAIIDDDRRVLKLTGSA